MKLIKKNLQIAIDGPVGAGKSVTANLLAKRLGITYVYTGAMYRAVGYLASQNKVDWYDEPKVFSLLQKAKIELRPASHIGRFCDVFVSGEDVTDKLFNPEASQGAAAVATLPLIRKELVELQKAIANNHGVVMEGRDITTTVLPQADLKIYMTADTQLRAQRRLRDLQNKGFDKNLSEVLKETKDRDYQDSHRTTDPLQIVKDAWVLDTTDLTIEGTINTIVEKLNTIGLIKK